MLETKLTEKQLEQGISELEKAGKVYFYKGWVYVKNAMKNNNYTKSSDNQKACDKEISLVPKEVLAFFDSSVDSSVDSSPYSSHKSEIRNKKQEIRKEESLRETKNTLDSINDSSVFQEVADLYGVPLIFVQSKYDDLVNYTGSTGVKYKDYLATLRNWVKRDAEKLRKEQYHANGKPKVIRV